MTEEHDEDKRIYKVVVNHEEQYSIWPAQKANPDGWRDVGKEGLKAECLAYVREVWTDMRPLSLRKKMEEMAGQVPAPAPPVDDSPPLVERLSRGDHPVEFCSRVANTATGLRERIESGFLHIRFPETRGGTELGIRLDRGACDLSGADFERGVGEVIVVGGLTLDGTRVKCIAKLDVGTLRGIGHLQPVA